MLETGKGQLVSSGDAGLGIWKSWRSLAVLLASASPRNKKRANNLHEVQDLEYRMLFKGVFVRLSTCFVFFHWQHMHLLKQK